MPWLSEPVRFISTPPVLTDRPPVKADAQQILSMMAQGRAPIQRSARNRRVGIYLVFASVPEVNGGVNARIVIVFLPIVVWLNGLRDREILYAGATHRW